MRTEAVRLNFQLVVRNLVCFLATLLFFCAPILAAEKYVFDEVHSIPQFEFNHLGVTTQTGRFDEAKGSVTIDFARHKGSVYYEIKAASLNMGYGTETPDSAGYRLFNVAVFPSIIFKSDKLIFSSNNEITAARGALTLLGVTRPLTVSVSNFKCATSSVSGHKICAGQVKATLMRSDFGMIQYLPGISDEIIITVPVEAHKE